MIKEKACKRASNTGYDKNRLVSENAATGLGFNPRSAYRLSSMAFLLFCAVIIIVQGLRPGNLLLRPISVYLSGAYSGWLRSAFYLAALATALFGFLVDNTFNTQWSRWVRGLSAVCGLAIAVTAFTQSPWALAANAGPFAFSRLHVASAATAFVTGLAAMTAATIAFCRVQCMQADRELLTALTVCTFLTLALDPVFLPIHGGLEKIAIVLMVYWQRVAARHLSHYAATRVH